MPERRPPRRGRRATPPPREILAGTVSAEELPDVVRPGAGGPPPREAAADPAPPRAADPAPAAELARSLVAAARLPLRLTEAALEGQAQAIGDWVERGAVPAAMVPGAKIVKAQLGFLAGMVRAVSGPDPGRPPR